MSSIGTFTRRSLIAAAATATLALTGFAPSALAAKPSAIGTALGILRLDSCAGTSDTKVLAVRTIHWAVALANLRISRARWRRPSAITASSGTQVPSSSRMERPWTWPLVLSLAAGCIFPPSREKCMCVFVF